MASGADDMDVDNNAQQSSTSTTVATTGGPKKRFEVAFSPSFHFICVFVQVKKWHAVALWAWDIVVDNCAICRNHIMDLCIECQVRLA
jgi:hypothetical protein